MAKKLEKNSILSTAIRPVLALALVVGLGFAGMTASGIDGPLCQQFRKPDTRDVLAAICTPDPGSAWRFHVPSTKEIIDYVQHGLLGGIANRLAETGVVIDDDDLWRNRALIDSNGLHVEKETLTEAGIKFEFVTISAAGKDGPTFVVLHDNEDEAFDTAINAVVHFGGKLVAIENNRHRKIQGIDPNRIFDKSEFEKYTEVFEKIYSSQQRVIALHNNTNACNNHRKNICVNNPPENVTAFPVPGADVDDLIWVSATTRYHDDEEQRSLIDQLNARDVNVLYEHVGDYKDHSMSEWAAKTGRAYFNIEAQHFHLNQQAAILDALLSTLGIEPRPRTAKTS